MNYLVPSSPVEPSDDCSSLRWYQTEQRNHWTESSQATEPWKTVNSDFCSKLPCCKAAWYIQRDYWIVWMDLFISVTTESSLIGYNFIKLIYYRTFMSYLVPCRGMAKDIYTSVLAHMYKYISLGQVPTNKILINWQVNLKFCQILLNYPPNVSCHILHSY